MLGSPLANSSSRAGVRARGGPQAGLLREAVIRNNKQNVTDLEGSRLFHTPLVENETYHYSAAEARFYATLTELIASGKAYASTLSRT
jgi:hypothetical protein